MVDGDSVFSAPVPVSSRRALKKPGRKPWKPTDKILDRIYGWISRGATYHNEIYTKLGISADTFYNALKLYPEIIETIEQAKADRMDVVYARYDDVLNDPTHKRHVDVVKHAVDRHDKHNQRVVIDHNITVRPFENKTEDELLREIDD